MEIEKRKKKMLVALLIALIMTATTLIGCSSAKETKNTEAETIKEISAGVTEIEADPTPEPTPEPTAKPTPTATPTSEVNKYEGIDMESTLPGMEWMETFHGIINEPVFVVYNDNTNKKVIVENGKSVEMAENDVLAIFSPSGWLIHGYDGKDIKQLTTYNSYYSIFDFDEDTKITRNSVEANYSTIDSEGKIRCTIIGVN